MDLITIVVPVYNVEKYISDCLDSLISQTYKNIEIILVDDGSTDMSGAICDRYTTLDARIKVIHKQNEGLGFARNTGLEVAQGKFVTFIDSDDMADADLVEKLVNGLYEENCDTCIGGFKRISENGTVSFEEKYDKIVYEGKERAEGVKEYFTLWGRTDNPFLPLVRMFLVILKNELHIR